MALSDFSLVPGQPGHCKTTRHGVETLCFRTVLLNLMDKVRLSSNYVQLLIIGNLKGPLIF